MAVQEKCDEKGGGTLAILNCPTQAKSGLEWAPRRLWWENKN
jgi:hypothetical protein